MMFKKIKDWVLFELFRFPKETRVKFYFRGRSIGFYKSEKVKEK